MRAKLLKILSFSLLGIVLMHPALFSYTDIYDIKGDFLFSGDSLYEFWAYGSPDGGFQGNYYSNNVNMDRFMRDFGSELKLYEWINGREYELRLGRFETWFTPLTLHITRFRWGYSPSYYNWGWWGNWQWDWGRWWDQRNARLRATKGDDEWVGLVAKTAYYNSSGSDTQDQWWTSNINKDQYFVAMRRRTEVFGMKMGFSFVNQHYTNFTTNDFTQPDFYSSQGPLSGVINDNLPTALYLRFRDDSPKNEEGDSDWNGAAVYEIRTFVNGEEIPSLSVTGGSAGSDVAYWGTYTWSSAKLEASGPNDFIVYRFNLDGINAMLNKNVTSVRFLITVANDYKIEASRDDLKYYLVARAPGNPKDYSNKNTITYVYGEETGTTVLGYDIEGNIPGINVPFKAEFASSRKFFKYPTEKGERTDEVGNAMYVNFSREFYPVLITGEVYDIDHNYDASWAVEDNDDKDDKPDIVDEYVPLYKEYPGTRSDDDFILFILDTRFREGIDLNNNIAFDNEENDTKPDYPYREGQKGYTFSGAYRPFSGMKLQSSFVNAYEKMSDRRNQTIFGKAKYNLNFSKVSVELRHEVKNTKDSIPDSLVYDPTIQNQDVRNYWQGSEGWEDKVPFRNNLLNDTYVTVNYKLFSSLTFTNRYLYGTDLRYYSSEFREHQNGILKIFVNDWFPFKNMPGLKQWQFAPMYKLERWNEQTTEDDFIRLLGNWRKDAFALIFKNKLTDKTSLFMGEQVVIYDDLLEDNDSVRYVFAIEITHNDQYWNRPLLVGGGVKFVNQEALKEDNRQRYEYYYIKAYFQW
ncbi:MAG: hypothetical protein ABII64_02680 [Elusimicrobiota bacterium]